MTNNSVGPETYKTNNKKSRIICGHSAIKQGGGGQLIFP